jgi:hypothetical protein
VVVLGLLLVLLAALLAAAFLLPGASDVLADAGLPAEVADPSTPTAFVLGTAASGLLALGVLLMTGGARRRRSKRRAARERDEAARAEAASLAEQNARLQDQLEREKTRAVDPYPHGQAAASSAPGTRAGRRSR